jgi:hypothetical protein
VELGRSRRHQARQIGRVVQKLTNRSNQIRCVGATTLTMATWKVPEIPRCHIHDLHVTRLIYRRKLRRTMT